MTLYFQSAGRINRNLDEMGRERFDHAHVGDLPLGVDREGKNHVSGHTSFSVFFGIGEAISNSASSTGPRSKPLSLRSPLQPLTWPRSDSGPGTGSGKAVSKLDRFHQLRGLGRFKFPQFDGVQGCLNQFWWPTQDLGLRNASLGVTHDGQGNFPLNAFLSRFLRIRGIRHFNRL